jgi:hypothetical protein
LAIVAASSVRSVMTFAVLELIEDGTVEKLRSQYFGNVN